MCGIAGFLHLHPGRLADVGVLQRMTDVLSHRGPDDQGIYCEEGVALGHRRLSVIDIAGGHQPIVDPRTRKAIVYNGEVYNFRDLRQQLPRDDRDLATATDTEVVLRFARNTTAASFDWVSNFNGMFAFAIWDPRARVLELVRDRLGVKPLYYCLADRQFIFASEIKSILQHPAVAPRLRQEALAEYLLFRSVCDDGTLFAGIRCLPPGCGLSIAEGDEEPRIIRYWQDRPDAQLDSRRSADQLTDEFLTLFRSSVKYRMIADVPVGTYNSGGVDSTLVTETVRELVTDQLHSFSVGFEESTHDERRYSDIVANTVGTNHHALVITDREYAESLVDTLWFNEEPLNHAHTVQLYCLSRLAKQFVTVVLTGEGADEIFAGYPRYQIPLLARYFRKLPPRAVAAACAVARTTGKRRAVKLLEICSDLRTAVIEQARLTPADLLIDLKVSGDPFAARLSLYDDLDSTTAPLLEKVLAYDRASYLPGLLHRLDRTTMAHGLEARVPFLDYRLVEWSRGVPGSHKVRLGRQTKWMLKRYMARRFPREMIYRRKMGFDVPLDVWLRGDGTLAKYLDVLLDERTLSRGLFDRRAVLRLVDDHRSGAANNTDALWTILNLELWQRSFIDGASAQRAGIS